jgi:hypothetical protein
MFIKLKVLEIKSSSQPTLEVPSLAFEHTESYIEPITNHQWLKDLIELIEYFERITPPATPIKINDYTTILDLAKFINSHIHTAWSYDGNAITCICLNRLFELKQYIEKNNDLQ